MPNPGVTAEMVQNVSTLEEFELTKDGVRPLTQANPAAPSPQASTAGAPVEPVGSTAETPPQTPTQTPTAPAGTPPAPVQSVEPPPQPVVEVIPGGTPAALAAAQPAPTEQAPPVEAPATPADEAAALARLVAWQDEQRTQISEEARRSSQSQSDRRVAAIERQVSAAQEEAQRAREEIRRISTQGLSDEEKARLQEKWNIEDERAKLEAFRTELVGLNKTTYIDSLLADYNQYGVTRDTLEDIESPEEMELHCEQAARKTVEQRLRELESGQPQPVQPAPAAQAAQPVAVQPEQPAVPPQPNVPAGALAPTDIGGGGASPEAPKFNEGQGGGAMQDNLRNMRWDSVRVRQA